MSIQRRQAVALLEWLDSKGLVTVISGATIPEVVDAYLAQQAATHDAWAVAEDARRSGRPPKPRVDPPDYGTN